MKKLIAILILSQILPVAGWIIAEYFLNIHSVRPGIGYVFGWYMNIVLLFVVVGFVLLIIEGKRIFLNREIN